MKCEQWKDEDAFVKWEICQPHITLCKECDSKHHPRQSDDKSSCSQESKSNHDRIYVCDEWIEMLAKWYWEQCEQYIWDDWNKRIHNKAARAKHNRVERNKLEPYFMMHESDEENEDTVLPMDGDNSENGFQLFDHDESRLSADNDIKMGYSSVPTQLK